MSTDSDPLDGSVTRKLVLQWLLVTMAFIVVVALLPGVDADWRLGTYFVLAALFGFVNALLGAPIRVLTAPLRNATLGLSALVVDGAVLLAVDWMSASLHLDGFFIAMLAAMLLAFVTGVLSVAVARAQPAFSPR